MILRYKDKTLGGGSNAPAGSNVPTGGIIIWSGASNAVPDGWALCDGTNGTPDLRGRFVLGESESHEIGDTGGSEEVTLTVAQMPSHAHAMYQYSANSSSGFAASAVELHYNSYNWNNLVAPLTQSQGSSKPHPNMPPYYVLCYIMKL